MDTQLTEIFGRNRLVNDLLQSDVEVATPVRDRGIDLIAYLDLDEQADRFMAIPIQIKTAARRAFTIDRKYAKFQNLLMAFVWGIERPETATIYAVSYPEFMVIGGEMGWLETASWIDGGRYTTTAPSKRLLELLASYEVRPGAWNARITSALRAS
ncbi:MULTISPECIES: hypothetical protein [Paraburkholderia]|uniref:DUF4365 domain-containing protein n=1 Tax=Paraburkholderia madseniana TaxID=2599607 RepID=A0AAP5BPI3_9BURK|nr:MULTISPECIES: hypothetical protein [Paraburkholderia]MCX4151744.1 hypothetical protein [Paraburkholderia madseniana]MDN7154671.1 hypothetical protein [Paraburkholderia sp. WS6]MDQ6413554.1 hypothetical protein [Paraburkholderia madseniana]